MVKCVLKGCCIFKVVVLLLINVDHVCRVILIMLSNFTSVKTEYSLYTDNKGINNLN